MSVQPSKNRTKTGHSPCGQVNRNTSNAMVDSPTPGIIHLQTSQTNESDSGQVTNSFVFLNMSDCVSSSSASVCADICSGEKGWDAMSNILPGCEARSNLSTIQHIHERLGRATCNASAMPHMSPFLATHVKDVEHHSGSSLHDFHDFISTVTEYNC